MRKYNKISIILLVFAVLFCISAAAGTVSAVDTTTTPTVTTSLAGGTYNTTQSVALTTEDPTSTIYYTTDGSDPRTSGTRSNYTEPIIISTTTTLRYAAVDSEDNWSSVYLQNYVIGTGTVTNSTGQSNYTGPQTNNTDWTYKITDGGSVDGSPAIGSDGTIYAGTFNGETKDGYLYAFNPNGTLKWKYHTGGIRGTPAIGSDGTIYVKEYFGIEYAFNPDGTVKWNTTENTVNSGFATIGADGTRYIVINKLLYAYNPDGTLKWTYNTEKMYDFTLNSLSGTPVIGSDGTIYLTGRYNVVYWDDNIGVIIATQLCKLYAINPDGTTKWTYNTDYTGTGPVVGSDGTIYIGINAHTVNPEGTKVLAINPDGTLKWKYIIESDIAPNISPISIAKDGTIYFGTYNADCQFYALNPDGTLKWKYKAFFYGYIYGGCTIGADGTIYFGTHVPTNVGSDIYGLNPDGTVKWIHHIGGMWTGVIGTPVISSNGTLYIGARNGVFYAFKDDTTKPTVTASPAGGSYYGPQNVTLTASEESDIYYTLDGTDPKTNGTKYMGQLTISKTTTLKYIAVDKAGNQSPVYTENYTIYKSEAYAYAVNVPYKQVRYKGWYYAPYKIKVKAGKYKVGKRWKYTYKYMTKFKKKRGWLSYWLYRNETRWDNRWVLT